jgi:hypothetical protein
MWSRTWRLDSWERFGISERIGKPGLVAALRNVGPASPRSGATIPARGAPGRSTSLLRGDGELRLLTDAFPAQDFRHRSSDSRREGHWGSERGRPMVVGV